MKITLNLQGGGTAALSNECSDTIMINSRFLAAKWKVDYISVEIRSYEHKDFCKLKFVSTTENTYPSQSSQAFYLDKKCEPDLQLFFKELGIDTTEIATRELF